MENCLFCKFVSKEFQTDIVYEDEKTIAFLDIKPVNPGHVLVIPKVHSDDFTQMTSDDMKAVSITSQKIMNAQLKRKGVVGCNIHVNVKEGAGQVIFHTHFHIIPRFEDDGLQHWHGEQEGDKNQAESILQELRSYLIL